ncbi:MAG: hypothetical protein ACFE0O_08760 [Opitutales bacterium]
MRNPGSPEMAARALFPTFTRIGRALWTSPTFTTWGNYAAQSLRLLLVTPLILTRFNETEIAAWYLFASLNFFGTTLSQRLGLTFSRMFAFAMGGASNLAPIKGKRAQENEGQPDWQAFERAYGTMGSINLGVAGVNVLIALGMGWFGLSNLLAGYEDKATIWGAFAVIQTASFFQFVYQRFAIALRGMNYVALANRWGIVFALLSVAVGSGVLLLGGNIIVLAAAMQAVSLAGLLRNWFLLRHVQEGRVCRMQAHHFDRQVFGWAWEPTWKGFVGHFGLLGSTQLTAILYTGFGTKADVASYLFGLRIMQTITQIGQAPFSAHQPLMSRLKAAGDKWQLKVVFQNKALASLSLMTAGICLVGATFPSLFNFFDVSITFIDTWAWFAYGILTLLVRLMVFICAFFSIGNEIVYYAEFFFSALLSALLIILIQNKFGIYGPIIASSISPLVMLNIKPIIKFKKELSK